MVRNVYEAFQVAVIARAVVDQIRKIPPSQRSEADRVRLPKVEEDGKRAAAEVRRHYPEFVAADSSTHPTFPKRRSGV
jgi:hypothetical protein